MADAGRTVSGDILPTAATMIGVCITTISLIKLLEHFKGAVFADEILEVDSFLFLVSAFVSYVSMRLDQKLKSLEAAADIVFLVAMGVMVIAIIFLGIELPSLPK
jgi:hypothetical protein